MPILCTVQMPAGKPQHQIEAALRDISQVLIQDFNVQPTQVRVTIDELPRNRYIVGGVMADELDGFDEKE